MHGGKDLILDMRRQAAPFARFLHHFMCELLCRGADHIGIRLLPGGQKRVNRLNAEVMLRHEYPRRQKAFLYWSDISEVVLPRHLPHPLVLRA